MISGSSLTSRAIQDTAADGRAGAPLMRRTKPNAHLRSPAHGIVRIVGLPAAPGSVGAGTSGSVGAPSAGVSGSVSASGPDNEPPRVSHGAAPLRTKHGRLGSVGARDWVRSALRSAAPEPFHSPDRGRLRNPSPARGGGKESDEPKGTVRPCDCPAGCVSVWAWILGLATILGWPGQLVVRAAKPQEVRRPGLARLPSLRDPDNKLSGPPEAFKSKPN
jgi:hypothetical protein